MVNIKNKVIDRYKELKTLCKTYYDLNLVVDIYTTEKKKIRGKLIMVNDIYLYIEIGRAIDNNICHKRIDFLDIEKIVPSSD